MFYYNATRDSDVWLQTPTATVSVRYGKEMKVPFVATIDMSEFPFLFYILNLMLISPKREEKEN